MGAEARARLQGPVAERQRRLFAGFFAAGFDFVRFEPLAFGARFAFALGSTSRVVLAFAAFGFAFVALAFAAAGFAFAALVLFGAPFDFAALVLFGASFVFAALAVFGASFFFAAPAFFGGSFDFAATLGFFAAARFERGAAPSASTSTPSCRASERHSNPSSS
ncbi:MAG TPA: hypothetical protein VIF62_03425, partial [Labilithrix sp.]